MEKGSPIQYCVTARTFRSEVHIRTDDSDIARAAQFLSARPRMPAKELDPIEMRLGRSGERYVIDEDGKPPRQAGDLDALVRIARWRLNRRILDECPGEGLLEAASLRHRGRRLLLVAGGRRRRGALSLRLLRAGLDFEGDDQMLIRPGGVISFPAPLHVDGTQLDAVPDDADGNGGKAPRFNPWGGQFYCYDPTSDGRTWSIEEGSAQIIFLLYPNDGGASSARPVGATRLGVELMRSAQLIRGAAGAQIATLTRLATGAEGIDLSLGDYDMATTLILRLLERPS